MGKVLDSKFFNKPAPQVAQALLGKYLVQQTASGEMAYMVTETEAYEGVTDLASHASKGRTLRTEIMFGEPGRFYIYLIYSSICSRIVFVLQINQIFCRNARR